MTFDTIVLGGGIIGLCAAHRLVRRGASVVVVDQFGIGHERGSSHGTSRITRSTYHDVHFVQAMQVLHSELWPALEAELGARLLYRRDGVFFGPDGADSNFERHVAAVQAVAEADVELIDPDEARRRFPAFSFVDSPQVMHDRSGGVLAASTTVQGLKGWLRSHRCQFAEGVRVREVDPVGITLQTDRGEMRADRLVVAAGAWTKKLLPVTASRLAGARQDVGYFRMKGAAELPVWVYLGGGGHDHADAVYYGLPEFERPGAKAARHFTGGRDDDPDETPGVNQQNIDDLLAWMRTQFLPTIEGVEAAENCFYTNTATEDIVLDHHPDNAAIAIGAGMSGHGFKLAPFAGRVLADLVLDGRCTLPVFADHRAHYTLAGLP